MENRKVLLSVKDLQVKFRVRGRILTAIRGISLDFYEGESIAIVGESGSGKSVFTKTFAGMLETNGFIDEGSIIFNDEELAAHAKHLTTQAKVPHRWEFRHDYVGYNYRMPNINAALGCAQLENLDKFIASKRQLALEYAEYFQNVEDIQFFTEPEDTFSNYWLQAVILKDKAAQQEFLQQTNDNGVMTRPIWELMSRLPMFEYCENDGLKNTIWYADRVVNIPSSVRL